MWCIKCKASGNHKDQCHVFNNYLNAGGPSPLNNLVWCTICQIAGLHDIDSCPRIRKYQPDLKRLFCKFCLSLGHDEHHCRTFDIMLDKAKIYRMEAEPTSRTSHFTVWRISSQRKRPIRWISWLRKRISNLL